MAKATKADPTKATDATKASGRQTPKLVPMEKRLSKLRKEEAKRRAQLDRVQARSARTKTAMSDLIASVNDWVQHPE